MRYGYARVSSIGQEKNGNSLSEQEKQLKEAGAEEVICECYTGTKMDRPLLTPLLEGLEAGDTLFITKLDRLARTATEGGNIVKELHKKGIKIHILNMGLIDDTPMGKLMVQMMLAFAEFERDMIVERTQEGKAAARMKEGYREGRKPLEVPRYAEYAEKVAAGDLTVTMACHELGISRSKWYRLQ